jgi:hypothetical protein
MPGTEPVVGVRVVLLCTVLQVELKIAEQLVVVADQIEVDLEALLHIAISESLSNSRTIGLVGHLLGRHF